MKVLVVIPCRNESNNLEQVLDSLNNQDTKYIQSVIIVENNSTDETYMVAQVLSKRTNHYNFAVDVIQYKDRGNLSSAVEFAAFVYASTFYLQKLSGITHIMKLDADVRLNRNYFRMLLERNFNFDLTGGRLPKEQFMNVPGCIKLYSLRGFELIKKLPTALGWDVLDEVLLRKKEMEVVYCREAGYEIVRVTGSSEGLLRGRRRLGLVCKFTGYTKVYFLLKFIRYFFRKPFAIGSMAMLAGYLSSQASPFDKNLIEAYRDEQKKKLRAMLVHPLKWLEDTYK